ncbi:DUF3489 domain-containing protein [Bradyrhizobium sp.]|uniref:DUF3489 domain-containing protein n=1 Tax=Bradyrhizobium sp. TaxID=376 RepID=UPI0026051E9E|nr:DUF3489 domain-containing protein [Bradyrhizobium sp.]
MTKPSVSWSQDYTVKSNARRAARAAGIDPSTVSTFVKAGQKLYRYPLNALPTLVRAANEAAKKKADKAKTRKTPKPAAIDKNRRNQADDFAFERSGNSSAKTSGKFKSNTDYIQSFNKPAEAPKEAPPPKPRTSPRTGWAKASAKKAVNDAAPKADRGLKFTAVAALLRRPGGASITEVCAATGWKPHSARARISVDVSKLLAVGDEIIRRREDGVSHYAIVRSKQMELPGVSQEGA